MSEYHGDIDLGDTVQWTFTTVDSTGLPTVLTGTPTATAYTDGGIVQSATGVTLTADFDGVVGLNLISIVATSGNGFAAGENIEIVLSAGTVGGVSVVGYAVGGFSIANRSPLRPTTIGRTLDVLATGEVPIDFDTSIGTLAAAQIEAAALNGKGDWNIGKTGYSLTQAFPSNFADMSITVTTGLVDITQTAADKVWASASRTLTAFSTALAVSVWDVLETAILTASSIGLKVKNNLNAVLSDVEADTQDIQSRLPAALVGGAIDADVSAMQAGTITAAAIATDAIDDDAIATGAIASTAFAAGAIDSAAIAAGAITATEAPNLDAAISTRATPAQVNTEVLDVMNVDTITLPGQEAPPLAPTHRQAIGWLYKVFRNRKTQTATQWSLLADDETTVDAKATVSDDATTAIKQEVVTGP